MKTCVVRILAVSVFFHTSIIYAQWQPDGIAISTYLNGQYTPAIVSDGLGGAIVVWQDGRDDISDVYAQRVSASGAVLWTANGVAVCACAGNQCYPTIATDGAGGAIVTWQDGRNNGLFDIYAQRVDASGAVQWMPGGVPLSTATNDQCYPTVVADGLGGAILTWHDFRSGTDYDVYAQRVDAAGVGMWQADGVVLCIAANNQQYPTIVSDGGQGAIATWYDGRIAADYNIYAQHVSAAGAVQWTPNGVALCTAPRPQYLPTIVSDGAGGAIVTWQDYRSASNYDVYAQRVSASGAVQWTLNGVALCTAASDQATPKIVSDGAGGGIVTWDDFRSGTNRDIYAQRVSASGVLQWPANGAALCTAADDQSQPAIVSDAVGGAIIAWRDFRNGVDYDIYSQRVSAPGVVQWATNGVALCAAADDQFVPTIGSDGAGGAIVAWQDIRSGSTFNSDIYAQRVNPDGLTPTRVRDNPSVSAFALTPNYPNPFSAETALDFNLRDDAVAEVQVFDAAGRRVREIEMGRVSAGSRRLSFDGLDDAGRPLPSGVYFYRVTAAGGTITRKMVITR